MAKKRKAKKKSAGKRTRKSAVISSLLLRKSGCTANDLLAATKWPTMSVPLVCRRLKIKLRKEKTPGKPTRYFGSAASKNGAKKNGAKKSAKRSASKRSPVSEMSAGATA